MGELLQTISSEELTEWAAYYRLDPFGGGRGDLQAAIMASTVWNVNVKPSHRLKPKDFMPTFGEPETETLMTAQEIHARLSMMMGRTSRG